MRPVRAAAPALGPGPAGCRRAAPPASTDAGTAADFATVRAAALQAAAPIGCPPPLAVRAITALEDEAWQVREGAARALAAADPALAVPALLAARHDPNLDARRAAVQALTAWTDRPEVTAALRAAQIDADADVRTYARHALATARDRAGQPLGS